MSLELDLFEISTHDSTFTRGYWVGYVLAKLESNLSFDIEVPASQLPGLLRLIKEHDALTTVTADLSTRNQYSVEFALLSVKLPSRLALVS